MTADVPQAAFQILDDGTLLYDETGFFYCNSENLTLESSDGLDHIIMPATLPWVISAKVSNSPSANFVPETVLVVKIHQVQPVTRLPADPMALALQVIS